MEANWKEGCRDLSTAVDHLKYALSAVSTKQALTVLACSFVVAQLVRKIVNRIVNPPFDIKGKKVLITGASSGIGAAFAELCVLKGASEIHLVARTEAALEIIQRHIIAKKDGRPSNSDNLVVITHPVDCSVATQVTRMGGDIVARFGAPDLIVNCAGAGKWRFLTEMEADEIRSCMDAPYFAAAFVCRAFLPALLAKNGGRIVNVQSPAGYQAWGGATAYISARYALRGLTAALQADLHRTNVQVQEVILGETASNYFIINAGSYERMPWIARFIKPVLSPMMAAQAIVAGIESGPSVHAAPYILHILMQFQQWCPDLVAWVTKKTGAGLKGGEKRD